MLQTLRSANFFIGSAFMTTRTLALALALITCACVASEVAAQTIIAPASSAGTSLRATVGINLSNYATQSQVSNVDSRVTNVDNRVTTVDGRVTNVDSRVTNVDGRVTNVDSRVTNVHNTAVAAQNTANAAVTSAASARPWPKAFPGQSRNACMINYNNQLICALYVPGLVAIAHDGLVNIYYKSHIGPIQIGGGKYTGGASPVVFDHTYIWAAINSDARLWNAGSWLQVVVFPTGWDAYGNPTDFAMHITETTAIQP
jgi:hypothetical protein